MKNIIKKINILAVTAMLLGGGFAFATTTKEAAPMYKFQDGLWQPIPSGETHICTDSELNCTATELVDGKPSGVIETGVYTPNN